MRLPVVAICVSIAVPAFAADALAPSCWTDEQKARLKSRMMEMAAVSILEKRSRLPQNYEATRAYPVARKALADCEAARPRDAPEEACASERIALNAASDAYAAEQAANAKAREEFKAGMVARAKAVMAEFPPCPKADVPPDP